MPLQAIATAPSPAGNPAADPAEIAAALTACLELDALLVRLNASALEQTPALACCALIVESERGVLRCAAVAGAGCEDLAEREAPLARLSATMLVEAQDLARPGLALMAQAVETSLLPLQDCHPPVPPAGILALALRHEGRLLAVLQIILAAAPGPLQAPRAALAATSRFGAIALQNALELRSLRQLSISDDCTGLFNSRYLYQVLETEIRRSERFGYSFSFLFLDLDHFKLVNDRHGHLIGSQVLREFGALLQAQVRRIDWVFRYGGDEFAILLPQTGKPNAKVVAQRLLETVRQHGFLRPQRLNLHITASLGLAAYPDDATQPAQIVRRADELMYQIKNTTRDDLAVAG
ncbi:MAG: diguanylate cyclase [Terriglobales bacterium]